MEYERFKTFQKPKINNPIRSTYIYKTQFPSPIAYTLSQSHAYIYQIFRIFTLTTNKMSTGLPILQNNSNEEILSAVVDN